MKCNDRYNNRIWVVAALVILLVFSLVGLHGESAPVIALEQEARCGVAEHIHTEQCPEICMQMVHVHGKNCYLVLLGENDINTLLTHVDRQQGNNLEQLIGVTLDRGLPPQQEQTTAPVPIEPQLAQLNISELNQALSQEPQTAPVVLNENLYLASALQSGPTDIALPTAVDTQITVSAPSTDGGISLLSVGDSPQDGDNDANYYVYLDGNWVCIGTLSFESYRSGWYYGARTSTSSMVSFLNQQMGTSLTRNDFSLRYATSERASTWSWAEIGSTYTTFGTYGQQRTARQAKDVRVVDGSGDPIPFYTVTVVHIDGTSESQYVVGGDSITLPEGYNWSDGSSEYAGGQTVEINSTKTFTALEADGRTRIVYNVNFPTVSGVTVAVKPTLYGMAESVFTDVVSDGESTVIRNVSRHEVEGKVNNNSTNLSRIVRFSGWQIAGTQTVLSANSTLNWDELQSYADGGRLVLNGYWEYEAVQTASFFVRYDSVAVDTDGNMTGQDSNLYTPELFATFVGGEDARNLDYNALNGKYYIADTSADNSFGADQSIRALYGEQPGIWLQSFPEDEYIFTLLRDYAEYLQVDGEPVNVNDLNANTYTIRWYVFKCQSDAWHIDGRLVKKEGLMHVAKTFAGNRQSIQQAKEGFYIEAYNADGDNHYILTLEEIENPADHPAYSPNAKFEAAISHDAVTDRYLWQLEDIVYGERWTVTEYPHPVDAVFSTHAAYSVIDVQNIQNKAGVGHTVEISGVTYATDAGTPEVLRVEFTNIYHTSDSIIIKKEDARTGSALGGATFRLLQNDAPLCFSYDSDTNRYLYDPGGSVTELSGSVTGYYEIVVTGFSYDNGNVTVQELEPPPGYTPVENIILGYITDPNTGQLTDTVSILSESPMARYDDGLLIVQNTTESTSVTVTKQWLCPESDWADVTVQLLTNGSLVSYLVPGVEPEMVLTAQNGYTATWTDLPIYANGSQIVWSVRETKIGPESCKSDHSFANWIVSYSDPVYTKDETGLVTNTAFTIENDTRRTLLRLTKTNIGGGLRLADAVFTLQHLISDGAGGYIPDPNFVSRTMTTGFEGTLTFDNLLYGYYRLTELSAPAGYVLLADPIYLTITESGDVLVEEHAYAQAGTADYSIIVRNRQPLSLPETGGPGRQHGFLVSGIGFMLATFGIYGIPKFKRRRERSEK